MSQSKYDYSTIITALSRTVVFKQTRHPHYTVGPVALKVTAPVPPLYSEITEREAVKDEKIATAMVSSASYALMSSSITLHEASMYALLCPHPSIPTFVECEEDWFDTSRFMDKKQHYGVQRLPILVTQFVKAAAMNRLFHTFSVIQWSVAAQVLHKVALVLHHIHSKGVVYGDIKPPNVLLAEDGHVWLVDFASALAVWDNTNKKEENGRDGKISREELARGITLHIRAPELFPSTDTKAVGYENTTREVILQYPFMIDFWAFGAFILEILSGRPYLGSFDQRSVALTEDQLRDTILAGCALVKRRYSSSSSSSSNSTGMNHKSSCGPEGPHSGSKTWESLERLLLGLLHRNPEERLGFHGGWNTILQHRFFESITFDLKQSFPMDYSDEISELMVGL